MPDQLDSFEAQECHYSSFIKSHPGWAFSGIYSDEGISSTKTKHRQGLQEMMADARSHKFDLILTKSLSRFARNTVVALSLVRELTALGITIDFEKESINTLDSKGEVLLTIMASLAQQESQSLSQNVKLGLQFRYRQGKVQINHHHFLGYDNDEDGNLVIIPEEAEVIRRIFREYLEGQSPYAIARDLEADGILTGAGKTKWYDSTVRKILQNEKYMGDALLQKTYTVDFLTKRRIKNTGELPQYYIEDNHEAIIPKHLFYAAQEEMLKRQSGRRTKTGQKRCYSSNNCFSNLIVCGNCGDVFRRVHWNNRGKKSIVWRCVSRLENKGTDCHARTILEDDLIAASLKAFKEMLTDKKTFLHRLMEAIQQGVEDKGERSLFDIEEELEKLQLQLIARTSSKEEYDDLVEQIYRLKDEKDRLLTEEASQQVHKRNLDAIEKFIKNQDVEELVFEDKLVRQFIEEITVMEDGLEFCFKTGAKVMVKK